MAHTQITARWTGGAGLPGYTKMRFNGELDAAGAATAATNMRTFFLAVRQWIPGNVSISWDGLAQILGTNGALEGEVGYAAPASVAGESVQAYNAAGGAVVTWPTGLIVNGRRLKGRTFLVPLTNTAFATDGTLADDARAGIQAAALALAASVPALVIFGGTASTGWHTSTVSGASVPDRAAVLRSRRD